MTRLLFIVFLTILFTNVTHVAHALDNSKGREFTLAFPPNYSATGDLSVFITSDHGASGAVEIAGLGFFEEFTVDANSATEVELPSLAQPAEYNVVLDLGVKVYSDNDISVYGLNYQVGTTDAFLAIPDRSLGTDYFTLSYQASSYLKYPSQFLIVATSDDTTVYIDGILNGRSLEVKLDAGEVYVSGRNIDASGKKIKSDKAIAVLGSVRCTNISHNFCDFIAEMLPPVSSWGTEYITQPLAERLKGDVFRVMAANDHTEVFINEEIYSVINEGEFVEFVLSTSSYITTSKPTLVAQYSTGTSTDYVDADPFMMLVPSTDSYVSSSKFVVLGSDHGYEAGYVNIVAPSSIVSSVNLDGEYLPAEAFNQIEGTSFSAASIRLLPGVHTISAFGRLGVTVYGFKYHEAYGYPAGMQYELVDSDADVYSPNISSHIIDDYILGMVTDNEDLNADGLLASSEDFNLDGELGFRTEDVNRNGRLDEGEDRNHDGILNLDVGIKEVYLASDSTNLKIDVISGSYGAQNVEFIVTLVDSNSPGNGSVVAVDIAGNTSEIEINIGDFSDFSEVILSSKINTSNVVINEESFSKTPKSIQYSDGFAVVEWAYDNFSPEQTELVNFNLDLLNNIPGESKVILDDVVLRYKDPQGNLIENSIGSYSVNVTNSAFSVTISTDKDVYTDKESLVIGYSISNLASVVNAVDFNISIVDLDGNTVSELHDGALNLISGETYSEHIEHEIQSIYVGEYFASIEIYDADGEKIEEIHRSFSIVTDSYNIIDLKADFSLGKTQYSPNELVSGYSTIQNVGSNSYADSFKIEYKVLDGNGEIVSVEERILPPLAPSAMHRDYYNLADTPDVDGLYRIVVTVSDPITGLVFDTEVKPFSVVSEIEDLIEADVVVSSNRIHHDGTNFCNYSIRNRGLSPFRNSLFSRSIINVDSEELVQRQEWQTDIQPGGVSAYTQEFSAEAKAYGGYACILEANIDGAWQVLASAVFEVQAPLTSTTASIGDQERLLVLTDAPRQCSAFEDIHLGAEFGAELSLYNEITVRLINEDGVVLDTEVVNAFDININQNYGTVTEPDLTVKATASGELEFILTKSGGMPQNRYQVEVEVKKSWLTTVEKSWSIDSSCDRPMTIGELYEDLTLIDWDIWSNDSDLRDVDPYGPTTGPDLNAQNDFIRDLLDTAGWEYTLVHTPEDLAYEHRTGDYGSYLILSERPQLHWKVQKEIREAVVSGKGLLVAGAYDKRNHWLEPALGMDVIGHHPWARELNMNGELFTSLTGEPLNFHDRVQGIWLDGASVIGEYNLAADQSEGWSWLDQNSFVLDDILNFKRKAITQYEYGHGRSLFFGFDLLLEASAGGSQNAYSNLLRESVEWIQPTISDEPYQGAVVPVDITWTNNRGAVDAYTELSTSGGASIVAADDFAIDATPISTTFSMGEGEVRDQTVYVELSSEPTQQLSVATTTVDGDQRTVQAEAVLNLNTTEPPSLEATQSELDSLAWQYWYRVDYRSAWLKYKLARSAYEAGYYNEAQGLFLIAADLLMDSNEPDVIAARKSLYSHIETTGRQLALGQ